MYLNYEIESLPCEERTRFELISNIIGNLVNTQAQFIQIYTFRDEWAGFDQLTLNTEGIETIAKLEFDDQKLRQSWTVEFFVYDDTEGDHHQGRIAKIGFESCGAWDETQPFLANGPIPKLLNVEIEILNELKKRLESVESCMRYQALLPAHAF